MLNIGYRKALSIIMIILILIPVTLSNPPIPAQENVVKSSEFANDLEKPQGSSVNFDSEYNQRTDKIQQPKINNIYPSIRDKNNNKISDRIDTWIKEGCSNFDAILIYNCDITEKHIQELNKLDVFISNIFWNLDMVSLRSVPVESIFLLTEQPSIQRIENYGVPILYSDIATPTVKARESELYSPQTAWELGYKGKGANIAVVDTGVDNAHPSLVGKWVGGVDLSKPETFFTPRDGSFDADDTNGHGTTCSGIATGTGAPDNVYMGAAPEARLVDVRIGTMIGYAPGELLQSYYDASLEGIEWVIDHKDDSWPSAGDENKGIDILSLSWGIDVGGSSDGSDPYSTALDRAVESGVIVCHAAGNSGPDNNGFDGFAAASNGISVASSDDLDTLERDDDIIASYSSRGPRHDNGDENLYNELKPDVTAPGTHINQAQFDVVGDGSGNGYGSRGSGTSYAAPVVAGIVALMLEANPNLTPELAKEILHLTAERRGESTIPELDPFWNKDFGWGIVDAYRAVKVSASITDVNLINVNLQCFITEIEGIEENLTSGKMTIHGLAFSKNGEEIEKIEIGFDDGSWKSITRFEEDGIYYYWKYDIDSAELSNGNHTINVRAVSGVPYSLAHTQEIVVFNKPGKQESYSNTQIALSAVIILIIAIAVIIYFYNKKYKLLEK
jgi:serine protease AprX